MTVLCDQDVLIYRAGWSVNNGDFIQNVECLEWFLHSIKTTCNTNSSKLILSGKTNFRTEIDTNYKSNRKDKPKPRYYKALREYSVEWLGAEVAEGMEADDMLGILQSEDTVICSSDKDLLQIPGWHYRIKRNWSDNHLVYVSEEEALFNFLKQCLMGDSVDCVPGLKGIGEAKATKALKDKSREEMIESVYDMYKKHYGDDWFSELDKTARLVYIKRSPTSEYYDLLQ